ncbi:hypothetical protein [Acinetobacter equi]|uniref:PIN-like domain-containing protein n=1 Tax=Acinetobacter equi TaxID=1324350 RepID=A0A0N9W245_9GAMM|nr:hypothetical protein [Acinetobacter equi]ALH95101.1 hypothetical protein AOY20_05850 [Acinetobacter equi]
MQSKVVLFDLENNPPKAQLFREVLEHYSTIYLFNCAGTFDYALEDLTEMASWITSGQIIILETPKISHKEFEYAMVVGQLLALLDSSTHIEIISASASAEMLLLMLQESDISSHLIQVESTTSGKVAAKFKIPGIEKIIQSTDLQRVKLYCDALSKMSGKPNTIEKLKNSVANVLQLKDSDVQNIVGMLINLKIVKKYDAQIEFRKKVLKQWQQLDLNQTTPDIHNETLSIHHRLNIQMQNLDENDVIEEHVTVVDKNFAQIDPIQIEVAKKLRSLKSEKPKDIYALRDLLEKMFPESDVRLLLKELLEKGYIYWNGHEILYSHEMFLN